jgi:hypothetical protein
VDDSTRVACRHSNRGAVVATTVLILMAAACGGPSSAGSGSSSNAGGSTNAQSTSSQLVAFAHCMRSNGVSQYPDPTSRELQKVTAQQLGVSPSQFETAQTACEHLLPNSGHSGQTGTATEAQLNGMRRFSQCMRSHGVPNWPDPSVNSQGTASFNLQGIPGLDSPQVTTAQHDCGHLRPASIGGIPVVR